MKKTQHIVVTLEGKRVVEEKEGILVDIGSLNEIEKKEMKNLAKKNKQDIEERRKKEIEMTKQQIQTIPDEDLPPAYIDGVPYQIIDGKYVPLDEAEIIFQKRRVEREQKKLEILTAKPVEAIADTELAQ